MNNNLPPLEIQKLSFHPICSEEEIERVFNIKNAQDYLLKIRAETIADNTRLFRVYRNKALRQEETWTLESSFSNVHYTNFLNSLEPDIKKQCQSITAGNIFSTDPNAFAFNTEYGPVITLDDSLRFFLKFMHLGLLDTNGVVPEYVAMNSMKIALRVMLQKETLDFSMDPRGIIPDYISEAIHSPILHQMQFIAGHEYAHHILGHVPVDINSKRPILKAMFRSQDDYGFEKIYSYAQKQEFEADVQSIMLGKYNNTEKHKLLRAALLWFACLELYETVADTISPPTKVPYHPPAKDRFYNLIENIKIKGKFDYNQWEKLMNVVDAYKELFKEDISLDYESYEFYGSVYFDAPNTEWRGRELIDRKDY
jgi:hypothetical protein